MKRQIYILCLLISISALRAQQLPQYTQYMLNDLAINPAVSGKNQYVDARSNNRYQWQGITDAPRTYMLTLHGPIKKKNMGIGMHIYTDIVGPTRRIGINFSYAYHLKLNEKTRLAMGLSAGIQQWGIDGHKLTLHDPGDENLLIKYQTIIVPEFGAGIQLYSDKYYIGLSVPQIYQSPLNLYKNGDYRSTLATHYILNGAYKFDVGDDFQIEPSFLTKYANPAPVEIDLGLRGIYKKQVWLGAGYRYHDAFTALVGFMYQNYLMIGYSYDFTTSNLRKYSTGTHEVMLGIRFSRPQAKHWEGTDDSK